MSIHGPYKVGSKIPDNALVGVDVLNTVLFVAVGEIPEGMGVIGPNTDRQDINSFGVVQSEEYCGPDVPFRVTLWSSIPRK